MADLVEFITLSRRPQVPSVLADSIALAMGKLAPWNLTAIDGEQFDIFKGLNRGAQQTRPGAQRLHHHRANLRYRCSAAASAASDRIMDQHR